MIGNDSYWLMITGNWLMIIGEWICLLIDGYWSMIIGVWFWVMFTVNEYGSWWIIDWWLLFNPLCVLINEYWLLIINYWLMINNCWWLVIDHHFHEQMGLQPRYCHDSLTTIRWVNQTNYGECSQLLTGMLIRVWDDTSEVRHGYVSTDHPALSRLYGVSVGETTHADV